MDEKGEKVEKKIKILLVGCGVMGSALKQGWERTKVTFDVSVIEPSNPQYLPNVTALPKEYIPDVVVFAVKPQALPHILPLYKQFSETKCLFVSIAASISLETYHKYLGDKANIIRVMPNLPVIVGQGMTALVTKSSLSKHHRSLGEILFSCSGQVLWLDKDSLMDVVTAISGNGPAYFFRMVECLAAAGAACGLPMEVAMQLARQTAIGAGTMLEQLPETTVELRRRVTSPAGTTAAALRAFDQGDALAKLIRTAVKAAIQRSQELAHE